MEPPDKNPPAKKPSNDDQISPSALFFLLRYASLATPFTSVVTGASTAAGLAGLSTLLAERLSEAKEGYEARSANLTDTFEERRLKYLNDLGTLQTEVMLAVAEPALRQHIMVALVEQTTEIYDADSNAALDSVNRRTKLIETWLERYLNYRKTQRLYRGWAVGISILALVLLFTLAIFGSQWGIDADYVVPTLLIPLPILMWSAIGSITSLLYRFNFSADAELQNPLRLLVTRPLTGIMMGIVVYLVLKAGFLTAVPDQTLSIASNELVWLLAFLAGFSDRFSDGLLKSLVGRLGENQEQRLFTPVDPVPDPNLLTELRTYLDRRLGQNPHTVGSKELAITDTTDESTPIAKEESSTESVDGHNGQLGQGKFDVGAQDSGDDER